MIQIHREDRVRRLAVRKGARLIKSRVRNPDDNRFGGYMLSDAETNGLLAGGSPEYGLTLEEAETWLREMR